MKKTLNLLPFWMVLLSLQAQLFSENHIQNTRNFIQEWVEVEKVKSKEAEEGALKLEILKNTNQVLSKQLTLLKSTLQTQKSNLTSSDEERKIWVEKEQTLTKRREAIEKVLRQLEPRMLRLQKKLPPQLEKGLTDKFKKLQNKITENDENLGERAQLLMSLLIAIQDFDKRIHLGYEELKNDADETIEVKVMYIGLSIAYYCSHNSELTGFAKADADQWQWIPKPELAPTILKAFKIFESEIEDAKFLALPAGDAS